ncbi:hypothetical protein CROQUDRAFT_134936 [Cronartium quercuum f. sp. fusiforme G11]|uniref:Uncharacterized protein n=1 Tax=Cronartium quercuum f. sp. fusiforme G11 TaxID=708437 RepID=A0A9P6T8V3_9BASI|nr:hypothetical protein CROQUDRAFT_134936 [Cronartium quercuum f. sp. fusiforme G11]
MYIHKTLFYGAIEDSLEFRVAGNYEGRATGDDENREQKESNETENKYQSLVIIHASEPLVSVRLTRSMGGYRSRHSAQQGHISTGTFWMTSSYDQVSLGSQVKNGSCSMTVEGQDPNEHTIPSHHRSEVHMITHDRGRTGQGVSNELNDKRTHESQVEVTMPIWRRRRGQRDRVASAWQVLRVLFFALLGHIAVVNGQAAVNLSPVIYLPEVQTACGYLEFLSQNYTNSLSKRANNKKDRFKTLFRKNEHSKKPPKVVRKTTPTKTRGKRRRSLNRRQNTSQTCHIKDIPADQEACLYSGTADPDNSAANAPFDPAIPNTYKPGYLSTSVKIAGSQCKAYREKNVIDTIRVVSLTAPLIYTVPPSSRSMGQTS